MAESWTEHVGQVVDGVFPLLEYLGGGQDHAVYLTERDGAKAAIKLIRADPRSAGSQLSRWKRVAKLSHPHLIRLLGAGECRLNGSSLPYAVMEYVEEDLSQVLPERPLSSEEAREILEPALEVLFYLHQEGFVHGHLKPSNIMAAGDQVKISSDSIRRAGNGNGSYADDVWALGVTMVEALTQRSPALGETGEVVLPAALEDPFLDIALHTLRRNPEDRWTISDISARLGRPIARRSSWKWRYAVPVAVLAGAAAAAMFAGRGMWSPRTEAPPAPAPLAVARGSEAPVVEARVPEPSPAPIPSRDRVPSRDRKEAVTPSTRTSAPGVAEEILPTVPAKARSTITGRVRVNVRVHTDPAGNVTDAKIDSSSSRYFDALTLKAVRQWKFQPSAAPQEWILRFQYRQADTTVSPERVSQ
jgi:TonB family protein